MPDYIRIEPNAQFKRAIVKTDKDGYITYSYFKLIEVCMKLYDLSADDAQEWVEYNILGLNDGKESLFGVVYEEAEVAHKVGSKVRRKKPKR
jgi:hypothetical protein